MARKTVRKIHRILLVDDHPMVRRGFADVIAAEATIELCGEAANATEAIQLARELEPDLMIVDLGLPDQSGLELIKRIKATSLKTQMLVSSIQDETLFAERCLRAGAMGYVNKAEPPETVVEAIFCVLEGEVYLSPAMTRRLIRGVAGKKKSDGGSLIDRLSDREFEVFDSIGRGLATREIAERLKLSTKTVETHRDKIKTKLKITSTTELTRHAVQWGVGTRLVLDRTISSRDSSEPLLSAVFRLLQLITVRRRSVHFFRIRFPRQDWSLPSRSRKNIRRTILKSSVPGFLPVAIFDQLLCRFTWPMGSKFTVLPNASDRFPQFFLASWKIPHEFCMAPISSVIRLTRRRPQVSRNQGYRKVVEERAMVKKAVAFAPQSVSGKLSVGEREVT